MLVVLGACVAPTPADPVPPAPPPPSERANGVVVTTTGVVVPRLSTYGSGGGHWVRTPCWRLEPLLGGRVVDTVDVVLDPGHGGSERGAVAETGLEEKVVNLAVAERAAEQLRADGYRVQLTRTTDTGMTIRTRAEIARALRPQAFVSIHHNAGGSGESPLPGTEVFVQMHSPRSGDLADLAYTNIAFAMSRYPIRWRDNPDRGVRVRPSAENGDRDEFGVLRFGTPIPTILTEASFLGTRDEADLFARDDVRAAEALAIANAVRSFLGPPPVTGQPPIAGTTTQPTAPGTTGSITEEGRTEGWPRMTLPNGEPPEEQLPTTPPSDQDTCVEPPLR